MKRFFLTLDYELWGNGKGDIFKNVIEPTDILLGIAERFGAKMTIFFEVVEYWRLRDEWLKGNTMGYQDNPVAAMENQLRTAVCKGHDVQLHIHPQWMDAKWEDGHWKVNQAEWRLATYDREGDDSLVNLLKRGKQTLEAIIKPVKLNYECVALRAGGYNAQPSEGIVRAMRESGLHIDSSIYPGGYENGALSVYDYRNVPCNLGMWYVGEVLDTPGTALKDIIEIPIASKSIAGWRKYAYSDRIKRLLLNKSETKELYSAKMDGIDSQHKSRLDKISFLFEKQCQTWDFCLLSPSVQKSFMKMLDSMSDRKYFTLVGHPKSFIGGKGFVFLLESMREIDFCFSTLTDCYEECFKQ